MRNRALRWSDSLLDLASGAPLESTLDELVAGDANVLGIVGLHLDSEGAARLLCGVRVDPELNKRFSERYLVPETNPVLPDLPTLSPGRMSHLGEFSSFDAYVNSEMYGEYARPAGSYHCGLMICPARAGSYLMSIGMKIGADWLDDGARRLYGYRLTQVTRALEIVVDRAIGERLRSGADVAGSGSAVRSLILDHRGALLSVSDEHKLALRSLGVLDSNGALRWPKGAATGWISDALGKAAHGRSARTIITLAALRYVVQITPGPELPFGPTCLLSLVALGPTPWTTTALQHEIGLTPRESEVTLGLLRGLSVAEIADDLGIGVRSVRVYLGRVFDKTGSRSQPQLVARLSMGK